MIFTRTCLDDINHTLVQPSLKKEKDAEILLSAVRVCCYLGEDDEPSGPCTLVSKSSSMPVVNFTEDVWRTPQVNVRCRHEDQQCPGAPRKSIRFVHLSQDSDFQPKKLEF